MKITNLASGSRANASVISFGDTHILLDVGLGAKEVYKRMLTNELFPEQLFAVLVTHCHGDHTAGLRSVLGDLRIPVYMTHATMEAIDWGQFIRPVVNLFEPGATFEIGGVQVGSFLVPHDAPDCCGFTLTANGERLAWITDLGEIPASVAGAIAGADVLSLECNHDLDMLRAGPHPAQLKQRIASPLGHLSNDVVADFLRRGTRGTSQVILTHLSQEANYVPLVRMTVAQAADTGVEVKIAGRDGGWV